MKTTTVEINDEVAQMLWNLVDAGMKHPEFGGARNGVQGAMCLQWLGLLQKNFNEQGNGAMPVEQADEEAAGKPYIHETEEPIGWPPLRSPSP